MKHLILAAALLVPTMALAIPTPVDQIEAEAAAEVVKVAVAPTLPFAAPGEASACAMGVDPLPDVLVLSAAAPDRVAALTFCFK